MWSVPEDVPEVAPAARAQHLGAHHAVGRVGLLLHGIFARGRRKGRPAAPGVVLRIGFEQLCAAAGAPVRARLEYVVVLTAERRLGSLLAQDAVLLGRQLGAPLLLGLLDLRHDSSVVRPGGAPNGIRTRATALKGPRPGPLVDGGPEGLRLPGGGRVARCFDR